MTVDRLSLSFHGAARTVTGSKHLLTAGDQRILLDAGLFQGRKALRQRNWSDPGFDPKSIDAVLLTHTHIDHVGFLPRLVAQGLKAPVYASAAACELAELMLRDSAKIQEEDARHANKKKYSKHDPALPLYTSKDVRASLRLLRRQRFRNWLTLGSLKARFLNSGHLLGSAFIELAVKTDRGEVRIVYSGDIGRFEMPLHPDPQPLPACDVLIMESTYGDKRHTRTSVLEQVRRPMYRALSRGGTVLIPAFAVGRSQQITLVLRRLIEAGKLPDVPIHLDSPMAIRATGIYSRFLNTKNIDPDVFEDGRLKLFPRNVEFHRSVQESKRLNQLSGPRIIIASSGMLTGGRVLHHLKRLGPQRQNLLMLAGYQAAGTRARALLEGADSVRIHGHKIPIRCPVMSLQGLSGHSDRSGLLRWVESAPKPPRLAFLVHGEEGPATSMAQLLARRFGTHTVVPNLGDQYDLLALLDAAPPAR